MRICAVALCVLLTGCSSLDQARELTQELHDRKDELVETTEKVQQMVDDVHGRWDKITETLDKLLPIINAAADKVNAVSEKVGGGVDAALAKLKERGVDTEGKTTGQIIREVVSKPSLWDFVFSVDFLYLLAGFFGFSITTKKAVPAAARAIVRRVVQPPASTESNNGGPESR